jgi:HEAT repeat protein/S1-C subfamily serine protease
MVPLTFEFIEGKKVIVTSANERAVGSYTLTANNLVITFLGSPLRYTGFIRDESMSGSAWNPQKMAFNLVKKTGTKRDAAVAIGRLRAIRGTGTGTLVDAKHRLMLINAHVAGQAGSMIVHFPLSENGALVRSAASYQKLPGIQGKVVLKQDRADLALLQLENLPDGAQAIVLSPKPVRTGQQVRSLGNPVDMSGLWVWATGEVRRRDRAQWQALDSQNRLLKFDAVKIDAPATLNSGDSGGPLVDDRGELVGIGQGTNILARNTSLFIDVSECRALIEKYYGSIGESFGGAAEPASRDAAGELPALLKDLDSKDSAIRLRTVQGLGKLGRGASIGFGKLFQLLRDDDAILRRAAADALEKVPPHKADAPILLRVFRDGDETVELRLQALKALGQLGIPPDVGDIPFLEKSLKLPDPEMRQLAVEGLGRLGEGAKPALPLLLGALKASDKATRMAAIRAIGAVGPEAKKATPALVQALKDADFEIGICAAAALIRVGEANEAVPFLRQALKNPGGDLRNKACMLLAGLGADAKSATNELIQALDDGDVRSAATEALVKIGKPAAEAISKKVAKTVRNDQARLACIEVLGRIGYASKNVVAALRILHANDPQAENRQAALRVLQKLRGKS